MVNKKLNQSTEGKVLLLLLVLLKVVVVEALVEADLLKDVGCKAVIEVVLWKDVANKLLVKDLPLQALRPCMVEPSYDGKAQAAQGPS